MQKNRFFLLAWEWMVRGASFGIAFMTVIAVGVFGASAYAQANPGGKLGEILNQILASGNWQTENTATTITVKDAKMLGGMTADKFVKLGTQRTCEPNKCVTGFQNNGNVICQ